MTGIAIGFVCGIAAALPASVWLFRVWLPDMRFWQEIIKEAQRDGHDG